MEEIIAYQSHYFCIHCGYQALAWEEPCARCGHEDWQSQQLEYCASCGTQIDLDAGLPSCPCLNE